MDEIQKIFDKALEEKIAQSDKSYSEEELKDKTEQFLDSYVDEMSEIMLTELRENASIMLIEHDELEKRFVKRNIERWKDVLNSLKMLLVVCLEAADKFNERYSSISVAENNVIYEVVRSLHARACHIVSEILWLLKGGYADGAHSRWRTLHEVVVTALFICDQGEAVAIRYLDHEIVASYKAMIQYNEYQVRLNVKPFSNAEITSRKQEYDNVVAKYGEYFKGNYGWASNVLPNKRTNFVDIEKFVSLDHMRPYYKMASHNVHANVKGLTHKLGLVEAKEDFLLVGPSNSGMIDPAIATALSLAQITEAFLNIDTHVIMNIIDKIASEVTEAFMNVDCK